MRNKTLYWIPIKDCLLYIFKIEDGYIYFSSATFLKDLFTTVLQNKSKQDYFEKTYGFVEVTGTKFLSKNNLTKKWQVITDKRNTSVVPFYKDENVERIVPENIEMDYSPYVSW